jgi:tetratricopeptide (TPR) repeat protein
VTGKAKKQFLWTGVVLALLGFLPGAPSTAYGGLAALDSFHIGRYHLANGERTKALDAFNDALRLNPQFVQAYVARGKLYAELGQYESALVDLNFALRLQPTHAEAFAYRGFANLSLGKFQEAMPDLEMALRIDPTYARVHFLRGQALKMLGEEQASVASIAMAKRLDPTLELSQVVTASANGSINDHALQINGAAASPLRTPITNDLLADQHQQATKVDRRMQGRLVPFEKHPILADVAPPSASRLADGTNLPPGFSHNERSLLPGGLSSGILRNRRTTTTIIDDKPLPSSGKIPDLTSPPLGERSNSPKLGPTTSKPSTGPKLGESTTEEKSVEPLPAQEMPTTPRKSIVAGGTPATTIVATPRADSAADASDDIMDLIPLPTTAELLTVSNFPPIAPMEMPSEPVTVAAAPAAAEPAKPTPAAQEAPSGVLGDMGIPTVVTVGEAVVTAATNIPAGLRAPEATEPAPIDVAAAPIITPLPPTDPVMVTDAGAAPKTAAPEIAPQPELTASEILKRRQSSGFVLPSKSTDDERRLASAVDEARSSLAPGLSTIVGDDAPTPVPAVAASQPAPTKVSAEAAQIADTEYRRGLKLEAEGDLNGAIVAYRQSIEVNPTDPQVYCRRGHLLIDCDRSAEALADFNEAVKLAPGLSNGYYGRAHVRYATQQFADACDDYTIAIRLDDQHAQALIERGHCYAKLGKLPEAKTDRESALALDPSLAKNGPKYAVGGSESAVVATSGTVGAMAFVGDDAATPAAPEASAVPRARSAFDDMFVKSTPTVAGGVSNIGKLSDAKAAISSDDKATAIVSDDAGFEAVPVKPATTTEPIVAQPTLQPVVPAVMPPMDMSNAVMATDEGDAAKTDQARKLIAPPRDRAALEADFKRLTEELAANPGDAGRYFERAKTSQELGDAAAAFDDVVVALRLNPSHAESLRLRAGLNLSTEKFAEAIADLDEALRLDPTDASALSERGYARLATGLTNEAITDLTAALGSAPDDVPALCRRGMAYALLGDKVRALADFDAAHKAAPQDAEVLHCRAKAHAEFGNKREAIADLSAAIKLNPKCAEAYFERSRLYAEKGAFENAQSDRRRALELDPSIVR